MANEFTELFDGIPVNQDMAVTFSDDRNFATVTVYGFPINAAYFEAQGMVMLQAGLSVVPGTISEQQKLFRFLLEANNRFQKTASCTFGVDPDENIVTLQTSWVLNRLSPEVFVVLLQNFMGQVAYWLGNLELEVYGSQSDEVLENPQSADAFMDFLRV